MCEVMEHKGTRAMPPTHSPVGGGLPPVWAQTEWLR